MTSDIDLQVKERIEGEAAEWVLTMNEGSLSDDTLAQWRHWIDSSAEHRQVYEKMSKLWNVADGLESGAALAEGMLDGEPGADNSAGNIVQLRRKPLTRWLYQGMAVAAVAVFSVYLLMAPEPPVPAASLTGPSGMQTAYGEHAQFTLTDGSVVELAADSHVKLFYTASERRIQLVKGEAFFEVAKNPDKPFIVEAGGGRYRALGTVFNVEIIPDQSILTVVKGVVQAKANNSSVAYNGSNYPRLTAGESVAVSSAGIIGEVVEIDPNMTVDWRNGRLTFVDKSLDRVFDRINRYRELPILVDPELKDLRYTGSVQQDSIDTLLDVLPEVFPVTIVHEDEGVYINPK